MRAGVLHSTVKRSSAYILLRPYHLGPSANCTSSMGLVCLGYLAAFSAAPLFTHSDHIASVNFLDGTKIERQRIILAVYPLL
jgi:hypothetical protein